MHLQLGAIGIGLWLGIALTFLTQHWQTALAVLWGGGFVFLLLRAMARWYKEDAKEASFLVADGDKAALYDAMEKVKAPKKETRRKYVVKECFFWLPLMGFRLGRKLGYAVFYPILLFLDREKDKAMADAIKHREDGLVSSKMATVGLKAAVQCSLCGNIVPVSAAHECPRIEARCRRCGERIATDMVHRCGEREEVESEGEVYCKDCDAKMTPGRIHRCSVREEASEYCEDCDEDYNPHTQAHNRKECGNCGETHCAHASC